jgi:hypothetical protein
MSFWSQDEWGGKWMKRKGNKPREVVRLFLNKIRESVYTQTPLLWIQYNYKR